MAVVMIELKFDSIDELLQYQQRQKHYQQMEQNIQKRELSPSVSKETKRMPAKEDGVKPKRKKKTASGPRVKRTNKQWSDAENKELVAFYNKWSNDNGSLKRGKAKTAARLFRRSRQAVSTQLYLLKRDGIIKTGK